MIFGPTPVCRKKHLLIGGADFGKRDDPNSFSSKVNIALSILRNFANLTLIMIVFIMSLKNSPTMANKGSPLFAKECPFPMGRTGCHYKKVQALHDDQHLLAVHRLNGAHHLVVVACYPSMTVFIVLNMSMIFAIFLW